MSAIVIILPTDTPDRVDAIPSEQQRRELLEFLANRTRKPPRSWPILVVDNKRNPNGQG